MKPKTRQIDVRLSLELIDRLWKHTARMNQAIPGHTFTFSDAIRMLLTQALDNVEKTPLKKV